VAAALPTLLLRPAIEPGMFPLLLAAVMVSAWLGGLGAGLFATALAAFTLYYFFNFPFGLTVYVEHVVLFVLVSLLISWLNSIRKQGLERVKLHRGVPERKRTEQALRESEERYRMAMQATNDGIWEWNITTGKVFRSAPLGDVFGHRLEDVPVESEASFQWWTEHVHPEDRERILTSVRESVAQPDRHFFEEYRFRRADGSYATVIDRGFVARNDLGQPVRMVGAMTDITERKRVEDALRQAEAKWHSIFENAVEGIFQSTPAGQFITANPALARMFGYDTPEELIRDRTDIEHQQYVDPERRSVFKRLLEAKGVVQGFEYEVYRKDGTRIWLSDNVRAVRDESGAIIYYEGTVKDITERKQMEEANARLAAIVNSSDDAIIGTTLDGTIVSWNSGAEKLYSYAAEEVIGRSINILVPPDRADEVPEIHLRLKAGENINNYETVRARKDGKLLAVSLSISLVKDLAGRILGAATIARDITRSKRAEEMLQTFSQRLIETQEAERSRVARELHDEIGQALTAIKLNMQAILLSTGLSPRAAQLKETLAIVDRAMQQVHDISLGLRPMLLDDLGLVAALRWYMNHWAQQSGLKAEFVAQLSSARLPPELETACFRIAQEALTNIVRHAQASQIRIELAERGAELHLEIRDDGVGFNQDAMPKGYAPKGSLGLQGMRERVLILSGDIKIKSTVRRGTEIHVCFPLTLTVAPRASKAGDAR
jgi:PAS domain S-box-containing protein